MKIRLITLLLLIALTSCSNLLEPIKPDVIDKAKDKTPPEITVTTSAIDDIFGQSVTVNGNILKEDGKISSVTYVITDSLGVIRANESVPINNIDESKSFSFSFSTVNYTSAIVLRVFVSDWNKNIAVKDITLYYPGSVISSLKAQAGNKSVSLAWDAIPNATTYNIYYTDNGNIPSENYITGELQNLNSSYSENNPLHINGLTNGKHYQIILEAKDENDKKWRSKVISIVPASKNTFTPVVTGERDRIKVVWNSIDGTMEYEVYRSTTGNIDSFTNITGKMTGNTFYDTNVRENITYYYKVKPGLTNSVLSGHSSAKIFPVTPDINILKEIHSYDLNGSSQDIEIINNHAYIAAGGSGLQVFNLSTGTLAWETSTTGDAIAIEINGDYAYVAEGNKGLEIFKVMDNGTPINPEFESTYYETFSPPVSIYDIKINPNNDNSLLLANGYAGLRLLNVSDKKNPIANGRYDQSRFVITTSLDVDSNFAYILTTIDGISFDLKRVDVGMGITPNYNGIYLESQPSAVSEDWPSKIFIDGDYIYAGGYSNLIIFDKNTDINTHPSQRSIIPTSSEVTDVTTDGNTLYILEKQTTIKKYDITDKTSPVLLNFQTFNKKFNKIDIYDSKVIGIMDTGGLAILSSPKLQTETLAMTFRRDSLLNAGSMVSNGDTLFMGLDRLIHTFDINSQNLTDTYSSYEGVTSVIHDIAIQNNHIYATAANYLTVINSDDPFNIIYTSRCKLPDGARGVKIKGDYAFVAVSNENMHIIDITNPATPEIVGYCSTLYQTPFPRLDIKDNFLAITQGKNVAIINITNPLETYVESYIPVPDSKKSYDVRFHGDTLIVSVEQGIVLFDISDLSNIRQISSLNCPGKGIKIEIKNDYIYLLEESSSSNGIHIINITDPANPALVKRISLSDPISLAVSGKKIFINDDNKLKTIDLELE